MGDADRADAERPDVERAPGLEGLDVDRPAYALVLELVRQHAGGERRREDRAPRVLGPVARDRPDVVLVVVRDHQALQARAQRGEEPRVRHHRLDPDGFARREGGAGVDQNPAALRSVEGEVHPDVGDAAERAHHDGAGLGIGQAGQRRAARTIVK